MKSTTIKKVFVFFVIPGLLIACLLVLVIYPLLKDIKNDSEEFLSTKTKLAALEADVENAKLLKDIYFSRQQELREINKLFIDSEVPIEFVNFLKKAADDSRISIKISLAPIRIEEKDLLVFNISLEGSFSDTIKFLTKVENVHYITEIQSLTMIKQVKKEKFLVENIQSNFQLKVFTKKNQ